MLYWFFSTLIAISERMNQHQPSFGNEYRIAVHELDDKVVARHGDQVIASSNAAKVMYETRFDPIIYFPKRDVMAVLRKSEGRKTFCPFKGTATYWDVDIAGTTIANGAWSYLNALPESHDIEGYVGFMPEVATGFDLHGNEIMSNSDGNISGPTIDWLIKEAWQCDSPEELTRALARKLLEDGLGLSRLSVMIWSLDPLIVAENYRWQRETDAVESFSPSYDLLENPAYVNSPMRHVANGLGGVRQHLDIEETEFEFPIMDDLKAKGATDYVAMPLPFSNGQINVMTLTSDNPAGFSTANLGMVFECTTVISRFYEVFALKQNAASLLGTYLGKRTGARVLGGEIRRGDGDEIDAAVLMCDLRNSSKWEAELDREAYLDLLNRFFELSTNVVNEYEGEVLKFIGDAVLAIFPVVGERASACQKAIGAANDIARQMQTLDVPGTGESAECAIGVAFGNVTYGNVGSGERLDFTVIGSAANVAARLGEVGKRLGHTIVTTGEIAAAQIDDLKPLGKVELHNVAEHVEAFVPAN